MEISQLENKVLSDRINALAESQTIAMAKKARATLQKLEKERARQQKQLDKAQRRLVVKTQRTSSTTRLEDDELESDGMHSVPHAVPGT